MAENNDQMLAFILLTGKRYSGKDTLADALEQQLVERQNGYSLYRCAFAHHLKQHFAFVNQIDLGRLYYDPEFKEEMRPRIIEMGEQFKRDYGQGFWAEQLLESVPAGAYHFVLITDLRFEEEISRIRENQNARVFTIRMNATEEQRKSRGWKFDAAIDSHASETELDHMPVSFECHSPEDYQYMAQRLWTAIFNELQLENFDNE